MGCGNSTFVRAPSTIQAMTTQQ